MNHKYGPDLRYANIEVGHEFPAKLMKITPEDVERFKSAFSARDVDLWGFLLFHRFVYEAIRGQFPDGNLHTFLRVEVKSAPRAGDEYTLRATVIDKYIRKDWKYLVVRIVWSDQADARIATIEVTHAVEKELVHA